MSRLYLWVPDDLHQRVEAIRFEGEAIAAVVRRLFLNLLEMPETEVEGEIERRSPHHNYLTDLDQEMLDDLGRLAEDGDYLKLLSRAVRLPLPEPWGDSGELLEWLQQFGYAVVPLSEIREKTRNLASDETLWAWLRCLAEDGEILLQGARGKSFKGSLQVLPYPRTKTFQDARQHLWKASPSSWFKEWLEQGFTLTLARCAIATVKLSDKPYPPPMQMLGRQDGVDLTWQCSQAQFYKALRKTLMRMGAPETRSDSPYPALDEPIIDVYWINPKWGDRAIKLERIER